MKNIPIHFIVLFLIFFSSCNEKSIKNTDNQAITTENKNMIPINFIRLEQELWKDKTPKGIENFLKNYPTFNKKYMAKIFPNDKISIKEIGLGINNAAVDTLFQITQTEFKDIKILENQFAEAANEIKKHYPTYYTQEFYTFLSGMGFWGQDFMISDSMIIVSLDYFLGDKCKYQPQLPQYILKRYRKEYVIPTVVASIGNHFIQGEITDNSLVAEMIFFGKMYYFVEQIMPQISSEIICGYTPTEMKEVNEHQDVIWAHMIDKKLLFETKNEITNRYIGERPNVQEIGNNCPGRIGRWLGWRIIKKYMAQNPTISLKQLMAEKDARKIFIASKYKPEM